MGKHHGYSGGSNHGHRSGGGHGGSHKGKPTGGGHGGSHHSSKPTHHHSGSGAGFTTGFVLGALASDSNPHCHSSVVYHNHHDHGYAAQQALLERERRVLVAAENRRLEIENARLRQEAEEKRRQEEETARMVILASHQSLLPPTDTLGIPAHLNVETLRGLEPLSASMPVPVIFGTNITLPYVALKFEGIDLFSEAINNKGYPLNSPKHAPNNPLVYITTMANGAIYLERVKAKLTRAVVDFLVVEIYNQVISAGSISQPQMNILNWLWTNNFDLASHADKFNYFAKIGYAAYSKFSTNVFSSSLGDFAAIDELSRRDILSSIKPDHSTLLKWYYVKDVFQAQKLCDDLSSFKSDTLDNDLIIVLNDAVKEKYTFGMLGPACLNWLVANYDHSAQSILDHLIRTQATMVNDLLSQLDTANQMRLILIAPSMVAQTQFMNVFANAAKESLSRSAYDDISTKMLSAITGSSKSTKQENVLAREKILLAFVAAQFKSVDNVDSILTIARSFEFEWNQSGSYMSPRATEAMLKLAKTEILSRLSDECATPSRDVAAFMAKNRTTHHFFCMPFQLTMFSTPSTKAYNLFGKRDAFQAAVAKEVKRGEDEFRTVMSA